MARKLSSFTIIELVITLTVGAIVISICYYAYFLFSGQFKKFQEQSHTMNEYYLFSSSLQQDAEKSDIIRDTLDSNHINFIASDTIINYLIEPNFAIRASSLKSDTFEIRGITSKVYYVSDSFRLIKRILLKAIINNELVTFNITKEYSAKQIMDAEQERNEQDN